MDYCDFRDVKDDCSSCSADEYELGPGDAEFIGAYMSTDAQVLGMLRARACHRGPKPVIKVREKITVHVLFVHQPVNRYEQLRDHEDDFAELVDRNQRTLVERPVYFVGGKAPRRPNIARGFVRPHPKTRAVTFLILEHEPRDDDLNAFELSRETLLHLALFRRMTIPEIRCRLPGSCFNARTGVYSRTGDTLELNDAKRSVLRRGYPTLSRSVVAAVRPEAGIGKEVVDVWLRRRRKALTANGTNTLRKFKE